MGRAREAVHDQGQQARVAAESPANRALLLRGGEARLALVLGLRRLACAGGPPVSPFSLCSWDTSFTAYSNIYSAAARG